MPRPRSVPACGHPDQPVKAHGQCSKCYYAARYQENKDAIRARQNEYAASNRDKERARIKRWKDANREEIREKSRAYWWSNRDRLMLLEKERRKTSKYREMAKNKESRRRASKAGTSHPLTLCQWLAIVEEFDGRCAYCHKRVIALQQEHMRPLSRGGAHDYYNVVPACQACNMSKNAKSAFEWVGPNLVGSQDRGI